MDRTSVAGTRKVGLVAGTLEDLLRQAAAEFARRPDEVTPPPGPPAPQVMLCEEDGTEVVVEAHLATLNALELRLRLVVTPGPRRGQVSTVSSSEEPGEYKPHA